MVMNRGRYASDKAFKELQEAVNTLINREYMDDEDDNNVVFCTMSCNVMTKYGRGCAFRKVIVPDGVVALRNSYCPHDLKDVCDSVVPYSKILKNLKESEW